MTSPSALAAATVRSHSACQTGVGPEATGDGASGAPVGAGAVQPIASSSQTTTNIVACECPRYMGTSLIQLPLVNVPVAERFRRAECRTLEGREVGGDVRVVKEPEHRDILRTQFHHLDHLAITF